MANMNKSLLLTVVFALVSLCFPLLAVEDTTGELASLRKIYEQALKKIQNDYTTREIEWPRKYVKALKVYQGEKQKKGDLEGWSAAEKEIKRFEGVRQIPEDALVAGPRDLEALQVKYRNLRASYKLTKCRKISALSGKYVDRLKSEQKKLTRAGEIEGALLVKTEMERVKSTTAVTAAEFEIALAKARKTTETKSSAIIGQPREDKPPAKEKTFKAMEELPNGVTVYRGARPSSLSGKFYKRLSLRSTRHVRTSKFRVLP